MPPNLRFQMDVHTKRSFNIFVTIVFEIWTLLTIQKMNENKL